MDQRWSSSRCSRRLLRGALKPRSRPARAHWLIKRNGRSVAGFGTSSIRVQRAKRQFDRVDPENRLVASELEARWNSALQNVTEVKTRLETLAEAPSITAEQRKRLLELGADLPQVWSDPRAPIELKKQILRNVIEEIVVQRSAGQSIACKFIGLVESTRSWSCRGTSPDASRAACG